MRAFAVLGFVFSIPSQETGLGKRVWNMAYVVLSGMKNHNSVRLRAQERVWFKTAMLMYKASRGTAPSYESTGSCRRSAWSTFPPLCSDQSSAGTVRETVYGRRPGLPSRRTLHLEQPAGQRDICPVSVNLLPAFKNISVPGLVTWHYHWSPVNYSAPPVDPEVILLLGPL